MLTVLVSPFQFTVTSSASAIILTGTRILLLLMVEETSNVFEMPSTMTFADSIHSMLLLKEYVCAYESAGEYISAFGHLSTIRSPIVVTLTGIIICLNELHFSNVNASIEVTLSGIVILESNLQLVIELSLVAKMLFATKSY